MDTRSYHRYSTAFPAGRSRPTDRVELGPGVADDVARRLLGDVTDRRVLELGCGMGHGAVALASMGARVTAIDPDEGQLHHARELAADHHVTIELRRADLADLAFLPPGGFDLAVAVHSLAAVDDADRVFRQVHRMLHPGGTLVVSMPHPAAAVVDEFDEQPDRVVRRYLDREPLGSGPSLTHRYTIADLFGGLTRADLTVEAIVEAGPVDRLLPTTVVLKARR